MTPNTQQTAALLAARIAHQQRQTATTAYTQALAHAHRAGCSYAQIASTLGVTRQSIRQHLLTN